MAFLPSRVALNDMARCAHVALVYSMKANRVSWPESPASTRFLISPQLEKYSRRSCSVTWWAAAIAQEV